MRHPSGRPIRKAGVKALGWRRPVGEGYHNPRLENRRELAGGFGFRLEPLADEDHEAGMWARRAEACKGWGGL